MKDSLGAAIVGASVVVKNERRGIMTDNAGRFTLEVESLPVTLVISSIGYETREVKVNTAAAITVVLQLDVIDETDVTISTGIFNKKKETYTGATTVITAQELQQFGTRNIITSLRNIDPSFNILESNVFGSNPNRLPEIQIRGNSNIPNVNELQDENRVIKGMLFLLKILMAAWFLPMI